MCTQIKHTFFNRYLAGQYASYSSMIDVFPSVDILPGGFFIFKNNCVHKNPVYICPIKQQKFRNMQKNLLKNEPGFETAMNTLNSMKQLVRDHYAGKIDKELDKLMPWNKFENLITDFEVSIQIANK